MSAENLNRRNFLKKSVIASAGATLGISLEEKALLANTANKAAVKLPAGAVNLGEGARVRSSKRCHEPGELRCIVEGDWTEN